MNQNTKNKIRYIAVTLIFTIIVNISSLSFAHAAVSASSLVALANASRAKAGLTALTTNSQLESAARAKADDMFKNQYFAHNSPQGKTPWNFISDAGYSYVYAGENLAIGYGDSAELHNAWMNSPTHRENIMNPNYREIGLASVDGVYEGANTTIVVQEFGSNTTQSPVVVEQNNENVNSNENLVNTSGGGGPVADASESQPISFEIKKDQTTYSPDKIFTGDEVTLKATITGETKEVYFTVGDEKITLDNTLEKKVVINQAGDLKVTLTAIDGAKNQKTEDIGTLKVAKKVIMNASTENNNGSKFDSIISSITNMLSKNLMTVSLVTIVLTLGLAGYFIFRQRKYGKFI